MRASLTIVQDQRGLWAAILVAALAIAPARTFAQCEEGVVSACRSEGARAAAEEDHGRALQLYHHGCERGDDASCGPLVDTLAAHPEARASVPQVWVLLLARCEQGDDASCAQLGRDTFDDLDRLRASRQVLPALVAACDRDVGAACAGRGAIMEAQRSRSARAEAAAHFTRACRLEDGRGCRRLGQLFEARDAAGALARFTQGCGFGDPISCGYQGRALAPSDAAGAAPLLERACAARDAESCVWLGRMNEQRVFFGANDEAAERAFATACRVASHPEACGRLGASMHARGEDAAAEPLLRTSCAGRWARGCATLGDVLSARGERADASRAFRQAHAALSRDCRRGDGDACSVVAALYREGRGVPASEARAREWSARACAAGTGDRAQCLDVGVALATTAAGRRSAQPILASLCRGGEPRACGALAPILPRQQQEAVYRRACELGEAAACEHAPGAQLGSAVALAAPSGPMNAQELAAAQERERSEAEERRRAADRLEAQRAVERDAQHSAREEAARARAELEARATPQVADQRASIAPTEARVAEAHAEATAPPVAQVEHADTRVERTDARAQVEPTTPRVAEPAPDARAVPHVAETSPAARAEAAPPRASSAEPAARVEAPRVVQVEPRVSPMQPDAHVEAPPRVVQVEPRVSPTQPDARVSPIPPERSTEPRAQTEPAPPRVAAQTEIEARPSDGGSESRGGSDGRAIAPTEPRAAEPPRVAQTEAAPDPSEARAQAAQPQASADAERQAQLAARAAAEARAREAEERAAELRREQREAAEREAQARREARDAAQARTAAEARAADEAQARQRAEQAAERERQRADRAAQREREARAQAAAREAEQQRLAEEAAQREAAQQRAAREAAEREATARREAQARADAQRRESLARAEREARARRQAEQAAARERAARARAEQAVARERAAREQAEQRLAEQQRRAEQAAASAAEARRQAEERQRQLARSVQEAQQREQAARAQQAAREAEREAAARREAAERAAAAERTRVQQADREAAARREAAERAAAAERARVQQAERAADPRREAADRAAAAERARAERARERRAAAERTSRARASAAQTELDRIAAACDAGQSEMCERAGIAFSDGAAVTADPERALYYFELACTAQRASACTAAIALVAADQRVRLARLHAGVCASGEVDACDRALALLDGTESTDALRAHVASLGCALERSSACVVAGDARRTGHGAERDRRGARDAYARACTSQHGEGCGGMSALCREGWLDACSDLAHACDAGIGAACDAIPAVSDRPASQGRARRERASSSDAAERALSQRAGELRQHGDDHDAAYVLETESARQRSARIGAELALAYQGAGQPVEAERHLRAALAADRDAWIEENRAGLELAMRYVQASLGWVVVQCTREGDVRSVTSSGDVAACGEPLRLGAGEQQIEVRAAGHRSAREPVRVVAGQRARVRVSLEAFECERPGMEHVGGAEGGCCWPGQSWEEGCVGTPECPDGGWLHGSECMSPDTPRPGPPRLATFHVGLFGGVTNFARTDTSLFRPGVAASGQLDSLGPRVELRAGVRLGGLFGLDLTIGGTRQEMAEWLDCGPSGANCVSGAPLTYTLDAGLMLTAHTNPPRLGGNVDFHVGIGARPVARIFFDDGGDLMATVVPAELGMSIFFADVLSLDLVGQAELWLPWEYCGHGAGGAAYCLGPDALDYELAWSGLAGLTLHAD